MPDRTDFGKPPPKRRRSRLVTISVPGAVLPDPQRTADARRLLPCRSCVGSSLENESDATCTDAVGSQSHEGRCLACAKNNLVCRPVSRDVAAVAIMLADALSAEVQERTMIDHLRQVVRFQLDCPGVLVAPHPPCMDRARVAGALKSVDEATKKMADIKEELGSVQDN